MRDLWDLAIPTSPLTPTQANPTFGVPLSLTVYDLPVNVPEELYAMADAWPKNRPVPLGDLNFGVRRPALDAPGCTPEASPREVPLKCALNACFRRGLQVSDIFNRLYDGHVNWQGVPERRSRSCKCPRASAPTVMRWNPCTCSTGAGGTALGDAVAKLTRCDELPSTHHCAAGPQVSHKVLARAVCRMQQPLPAGRLAP